MKNKKPDLTELDKLEKYLLVNNYNYVREDRESNECDHRREWHQIRVYNAKKEQLWDVICHTGSYGYEQGLLEVMNGNEQIVITSDGVMGYLTAQNIIDMLEKKVLLGKYNGKEI